MCDNEEKKELLNTFNNHFQEMVNDISIIYPNDMLIKVLNKSLNMLFMVSKKNLINFFRDYLKEKYYNEIMSGDLSFFMNKNYDSELTDDYKSDNIINNIEYVKSLVKNLDENEQNKIIGYFKNLMIICDLYFNE